MAKVALNPIFEKVQGRVGDLVLKHVGDEVVMARMPDLTGVTPTAAQLETRQRFQTAALYGKVAMADATLRQAYERVAKERNMPVFSLPVADFFNAPTVDSISTNAYTGQPGETLVVTAHDDFAVTGVSVEIRDAANAVVESGPATGTPGKSGQWTYVTTATLADVNGAQVTATAMDHPKNEGVKTVVMGE